MKTLTFSRLTLVIGLALGVMVLWFAATPVATGADSLLGGTGDCCGCCDSATRSVDCGSNGTGDCTSKYKGCDYVSEGAGDCVIGEGIGAKNCFSDAHCYNFDNDACHLD